MFARLSRCLAALACLACLFAAQGAVAQDAPERLGDEQTYWISNEGIYAKARPILDGPWKGHVIKTGPAGQTPQPASSIDPYGFTHWLNSVRAQYGLRPVGYDPNLTNWAAVNNQHQASRGMGHFVMGSARRQNAAMGNYATIGAMWLNSPAHASALLDPTIVAIGIAGYGTYWTYNAY